LASLLSNPRKLAPWPFGFCNFSTPALDTAAAPSSESWSLLDPVAPSFKRTHSLKQSTLRPRSLPFTSHVRVATHQSQPSAAPLVYAAKPTRRLLPEHLPRETGKYRPKQIACPDRGGEWKHLGEDVSEILEFVPARFKLIRQVRPKLACACC
jgi:transposase